MAAASSGSARVLRAILDKANIADELMMPIRMHALHEAAKNGHVEVIQVLSTINYIIAHFVVTLTFGSFVINLFVQSSIYQYCCDILVSAQFLANRLSI